MYSITCAPDEIVVCDQNCAAECRFVGAVCGDGNLDPGEECDDGKVINPLTCGLGECQDFVSDSCVNSGPPNECTLVTCVPGIPTTELCDGLDNDCDGVTDDGTPCPIGQQCVAGLCIPTPPPPTGGAVINPAQESAFQNWLAKLWKSLFA